MLWKPNVLLLGLVAGCFTASVVEAQQQKNTYIVYVPKLVRPAADISFTISILDIDEAVNVQSTFRSSDQKFELTARPTVMRKGESRQILLGKIPLDYNGANTFEFEVMGRSNRGQILFRNSTNDFNFQPKSVSILVQTDKAIYQPGQTIKFRAACLKPDLRPVRGGVAYEVRDPHGNIIIQNANARLKQGVAGAELQLHKNCAVGEWKISFTVAGYKEDFFVTVKHYKLPKFEVTVEAPKYAHLGSSGITVKLHAKYTYGKAVKGAAKIMATIPRFYPFFFRDIMEPPQAYEQEFTDFDGETEIFIPAARIRELGWTDWSDSELDVRASVTEQFTDETREGSTRVDLKRTNIKVDVLYKPETVKPGMKYTAYIKVSEQDDKPLTTADRIANDLMIDIECIYYGVVYPVFELDGNVTTEPRPPGSKTETRVMRIPANGIVVFEFNAPSDGFSHIIFRPYTNATADLHNAFMTSRWEAYPARSPSNSFIQLTTADGRSKFAPGDQATLQLYRTNRADNVVFKLTILSRGAIVAEEQVRATSRDEPTVHALDITADMTPEVKLLASYVRDDGEVVADYIRLSVSVELANQVRVTSRSNDSVKVGSDVMIEVQTSGSGAYIGARAIDRSVLLLKTGSDITNQRVRDDLQRYSGDDKDTNSLNNWWWWWPVPSGADTAGQALQDADLTVITDALIYTEKRYREEGIYFAMARGASPDNTGESAAQRTRTYFPETWLWSDMVAGRDGRASFNMTAPDTITSWQLSLFSVSDRFGLGIADPMQITVFREFFVNLDMPLKVTRGEIIIVQAMVFNYLKSDLAVDLTFETSDKFELLVPGGDENVAGPNRNFMLRSGSSFAIPFPVRMTTLGAVPFTVRVRSNLAGDAITREVFVRSEGVPQCYSSSAFVSRDFTGQFTASSLEPQELPTVEQLEIRLPETRLPGSENVQLFVYGDIMTSTTNNLGSLLREPTGCGEQNMVTFAPDVLVTLYLKMLGELDAETKDKAYQHFVQGYQNQLRYKHANGSYSAFGDSDASGSTWLTAFVVKTFILARRVRPDLSDQLDPEIADAVAFLVAMQNGDGSFREPGTVSHRAMQGGVDGPVTLTAYVLISLMEMDPAALTDEAEEAIKSARLYLEQQLASVKRRKYALAIVTYALFASTSSRSNEALNALEVLAERSEDGVLYWHVRDDEAAQFNDDAVPPYQRPPSHDVEMTSYALMAYVRSDRFVTSGVPIVRWLVSKRNDLGGYSSTQNTVIAIEALVRSAIELRSIEQSLVVNATIAQTNFRRDLVVDGTNFAIYNRYDLPVVNGNVTIEATGTGVAAAQLSVCYNVPENPFADEPFVCDHDVIDGGLDVATVKFCCSLKASERSATGMFIFQLQLPNGFTVNVAREVKRNGEAQLVELVDDTLDVYYDALAPGQRLCAEAQMIRYQQVAAIQDSTLIAKDYYNPDRRVVRTYNVGSFQASDACQVCGMACAGCPGPRLSDWRQPTPCLYCNQSESTWVRQCIDPNDNLVIDPSYCGLDRLPTQQRPCTDQVFPDCPDVHDGLWEILPQYDDIMWSEFDVADRNRKCRVQPFGNPRYAATDRDAGKDGIPGSNIVGERKYVECRDMPPYDSESGFSLSLLLYVARFASNQVRVLFAFGEQGEKAVFKLEQHEWFAKPLVFRVSHGDVDYNISPINSRPLIGQWSHIMVTWNRDDWAFYMNGEKTGWSYKYDTTRNATIPRNPILYIGRDTMEGRWQKATTYMSQSLERSDLTLQAWVSSLDYWRTALDAAQVKQVSDFYSSLLDYNRQPRKMSARAFRYFAPDEFKPCFRERTSLREIFGVDRVCRK